MDTFKDQQELDELWAPFSADLDDQLIDLHHEPGTGVPEWLSERYQLVSQEA